MVLVNIGKVLTELVFVLTNVWFDWGKCCIAERDADINVCGDCGSCLIESFDDDTNVCIEFLALPASPTLIVNVPLCLFIPPVVADTNVWADVYEDVPMFISKVSVVTFEIDNHLPEG